MSSENKVAVVTDGTKGIGYAIAEALARSGASVFVTAREQASVSAALDKLSLVHLSILN